MTKNTTPEYPAASATVEFSRNYYDRLEAFAHRFQEEAGPGFTVAPNGYGVRAECVECHSSETIWAPIFVREHRH